VRSINLVFSTDAVRAFYRTNRWKIEVSRTYVIADVRGRFDLLRRAMEAISIDARERRTGALKEHKIVILGNAERGPESEQIGEYLTQEQLSAAPIILGGSSEYAFVSTDLNPSRAVWTDSENGTYGIVARGGEPCGTPHALHSKPFAFRTVWAAGEERNVTSARPASV